MRASLFPKSFATAVFAATVAAASPSVADESWTSNFGPVLWESDSGEIAILRLDDINNGHTVRLYVPGLAADVMGGRGAYWGYWIADGGDNADMCSAQMTGPDGFKSSYWGQFTITFVSPDFPSDWAGVFGACFEEQTVAVTAVAQ